MTKKKLRKRRKQQQCLNDDCQLKWPYKGKKQVGQKARCPDCTRTVTIKAMIIVVAALGLGIAGPAYADIANFQFDTEYLNATRTTTTPNQTLSDGTIKNTITAEWDYVYPNQTEHDKNTEPVKGDPEGTFFDFLLRDGAGIFKAVIKLFIPDIEPEDEEEAELEKIRALTKPEVEAKKRLQEACDFEGGQLKAGAFQGAYQIFLDHPIEWYAQFEHKEERDKKTEECRGLKQTQLIANATIGEKVIHEPFSFTPTNQTQQPKLDYSIEGDVWKNSADEAEKHMKTLSHMKNIFDEPFQGDPVISTNIQEKSTEQRQHEKHVAIEEATKTAQITKCTEHWELAREGKAPLSQWNHELVLGQCDGFVFEKVDGVEQPVYIQEIIAEKIRNGDVP